MVNVDKFDNTTYLSRYIVLVFCLSIVIHSQYTTFACVPDSVSNPKRKYNIERKVCYLIAGASRLSFEDFLLYSGEIGAIYGEFDFKSEHGAGFLSKGYSGIRYSIECSALNGNFVLGNRLGYEWNGLFGVRALVGCYTNFNHQYSFTLNPEVSLIFGILNLGLHLPVLGQEIIEPSLRLSLQLPLPLMLYENYSVE